MKKRLKELRRRLKMTQTQFGRELNLSFGHISDMEAGRKTITDRTIADICTRYHVNETWLRTGEGEVFVSQESDSDVDATKRYLLRLFAALPENMQISAVDFMRDLLAKAEQRIQSGKKIAEDSDRSASEGSGRDPLPRRKSA